MRTLPALCVFATLGLVAVLSLACSNEPFHATKAEGGDVHAYPLAVAMLKVWTRASDRDVAWTDRVRDSWVERYRIDPDGTLQAAWFEADLHLYDAGPGRTAMRFDLDEAKAMGP
jgi:hypothetical protein